MANYVKIQIRRDSSANWGTSNPTLALGELGADMTLHRLKVGDGTSAWSALPWINGDVYSNLESILRMLSGITGGSLKDPVPTLADLGTTYPSPNVGDICYVINEKKFYTWDGSAWKPLTLAPGGLDGAQVQALIDDALSNFGALGMGYTVDTYNEYKKPTKITFADGVVFTLVYSGGTRLDTITSSTGEVMRMIYDTDGTVKGRTVTRT